MKYTLSLILSLFFITTNAQNYMDIVSLSYTNTPSNNFDDKLDETNIEEFDFKLNYPIVLDENNTFLTGLTYAKTQLKLDSNIPSTSYNSIGLKIGINKIYSENWSGTYMLLPKIVSNEGSFTKEDLQIGLVTLMSYKKSNNLKYKFGVYANTEKFGPIIVPLVGLYYLSPNKKFESNLTLPIQFDVNYQLFNKGVIGMNFDGLNSSFNLQKPIYSTKNEYVAKSSNELFSYLRFQVGNSIYLKTKVGYAISRSYKVYDAKDKIDLALSALYFGDDRTQLNQNFETGAIFKVELLYRFHFKN